MGNGFHHHHHHPQHHHRQNFNNKNTFLPLLCRLSIRDVRLGDYKDPSTSSSYSSLSDDPYSPTVSCIGHVKKNHHQFIDFSTPCRLASAAATTTFTATATSTSAAAMIKASKRSTNRGGPFKYTKLKRLFSGKNLLNTSATAATVTASTAASASQVGRSRSCREIVMRRNGSRRSFKINNEDGCDHHLNVSELDPPLPVPKKAPKPPSETCNLWKRRSGGLTLRKLQIEQIHAPNNNNNNNNMHDDDQPAATSV